MLFVFDFDRVFHMLNSIFIFAKSIVCACVQPCPLLGPLLTRDSISLLRVACRDGVLGTRLFPLVFQLSPHAPRLVDFLANPAAATLPDCFSVSCRGMRAWSIS